MPAPDPITRAERVQLVDTDFPSSERRRAAEYIQQHWNDRHGMTLTAVADAVDVSRELVKKTLVNHFEMVEDDRVALPDYRDGFRDGYGEGYRDGYRDAMQEDSNRPQLAENDRGEQGDDGHRAEEES